MIREIDELQLYFGEDYYVNNKIIIRQPKIGEILLMGEKKYYSMIHTLTAIPSDMKAQLDDEDIDYETVSDFELFMMQSRALDVERTGIIIKDINFREFEPMKNPENDEIVLFHREAGVIIDRVIYQIMIDYIRKMHSLNPKVEKAGNEYTKKVLIEESRQKLQMASNKPYKSMLQPLISSMVNSEGFKYNLKEVKDIGIYEFMDSVDRIQAIKSASSLLQGCYSGNIDMTKLNKKELNWLRTLDVK